MRNTILILILFPFYLYSQVEYKYDSKNIDLPSWVKEMYKENANPGKVESLYENCALALASDQNAESKGIYVPFFGKKASIPKGPAYFYYKTNLSSPIHILYI